MSDFKKVTDTVSVSPQISKADIDAAADAGFTLIINNRPDGEERSQPANADLAAYAAEKGLKWASIPVVGGQLTFESIEMMSMALKDADGPVLAFCRSGTRSCTLWSLAQALTGAMDTKDILDHAAKAGYDVSGMAPTLEHLKQLHHG
ncbi:TIGR01244 family sulfur transferase [Kordiimonas lipolytica]|uniref:TIGR01244 family sulfur transferase n=1 Tax=Kordiimonas lipolytica TaxID=1662421 RepID=A0ABV8U614_9PROT|nr:TIGR01244 family sulfur transferase [Kordiimonas lipolytica]